VSSLEKWGGIGLGFGNFSGRQAAQLSEGNLEASLGYEMSVKDRV